METTIVSNKGQVTIPRELRKQLGISKGSKLGFTVVDDHLELRLLDHHNHETPVSGFGMIKSTRRSVPADFDPATLLGHQDEST